jgi:probable HAF family extracellular repeat protein
MTDLGVLEAAGSVALGINSAGHVVGYAVVVGAPVGNNHAALWVKGVMTDLGTLGGESSEAYGINPAGLVVGNSKTVTGETHATIWTRR